MAFTEAEILAALRRRYTDAGNGGAGRYAFLTHVRTGAAHYQQEIDAVVMELWESKHHQLHAFEVKCSRSDWRREIFPTMAKSERTRALCDTFTIVAPAGVVHDGERPAGWGLIEVTDHNGPLKLRSRARPTPFAMLTPDTMPRAFVVAMMRAAGAVPGMTSGRRRVASTRDVVQDDDRHEGSD